MARVGDAWFRSAPLNSEYVPRASLLYWNKVRLLHQPQKKLPIFLHSAAPATRGAANPLSALTAHKVVITVCCSTTLRPDVVLWAKTERYALLVELTVPLEEGMEGAHERKRAKYSDLVAECRESGWSTRLFPVEVGTRGFVGSSMTRLLKELGLRGRKLHKATREMSEKAERASFWLWLRRRDKAWGASTS